MYDKFSFYSYQDISDYIKLNFSIYQEIYNQTKVNFSMYPANQIELYSISILYQVTAYYLWLPYLLSICFFLTRLPRLL